MFTVRGRGAECSLSGGGGGLSVHCQWGRGAECSLSVGEGGAECSLSVGEGG